MMLAQQPGAEFVGTLWLVLGGCGAAVLAAGFPGVVIGFVGVSLAGQIIQVIKQLVQMLHCPGV
jgi:glycerol uptake facilitator-like aquaporin